MRDKKGVAIGFITGFLVTSLVLLVTAREGKMTNCLKCHRPHEIFQLSLEKWLTPGFRQLVASSPIFGLIALSIVASITSLFFGVTLFFLELSRYEKTSVKLEFSKVLKALIVDVLLQSRLYRVSKARWTGHILVVLGVIMVLFSTTHSIVPAKLRVISNPLIFGVDLGGAALSLGLTLCLYRRIKSVGFRKIELPIFLLSTCLLGVVGKTLIHFENYTLGFLLVLIHIGMGVAIIAYAPYSSLIHVLTAPIVLAVRRCKNVYLARRS